jgi:hypothetical protein
VNTSFFPVSSTILIGSNFDSLAHEIANTAKDTRRDVVCVDGFLVLALNTGTGRLLPVGSSLATLPRRDKKWEVSASLGPEYDQSALVANGRFKASIS